MERTPQQIFNIWNRCYKDRSPARFSNEFAHATKLLINERGLQTILSGEALTFFLVNDRTSSKVASVKVLKEIVILLGQSIKPIDKPFWFIKKPQE